MVQKRDSGLSAPPLCLHSGCASGSHVAELLLKFLYNTSAGKSLLEIVYNWFRSFRFFSSIPLFFPVIPLFFSVARLLSSSCRLCGAPALPSLRLCVRPVCGKVATGIPIRQECSSCFWKSHTTGFDHSVFFFFRSFRFFFGHSAFFRSFRFFSVIPLFCLSPSCVHPHARRGGAARSIFAPPGPNYHQNLLTGGRKLLLYRHSGGLVPCALWRQDTDRWGLCAPASARHVARLGLSRLPFRAFAIFLAVCGPVCLHRFLLGLRQLIR